MSDPYQAPLSRRVRRGPADLFGAPEPIDAPVPPGLDLSATDFMPLFVTRLRRSRAWSIWAKADPRLGYFMMNIWMAAWEAVPCSSLEDDDELLAHHAGCDPKDWVKVRQKVMHGFVPAKDGLLYHPVLAEQALRHTIAKVEQSQRVEQHKKKMRDWRAAQIASGKHVPSKRNWGRGRAAEQARDADQAGDAAREKGPGNHHVTITERSRDDHTITPSCDITDNGDTNNCDVANLENGTGPDQSSLPVRRPDTENIENIVSIEFGDRHRTGCDRHVTSYVRARAALGEDSNADHSDLRPASDSPETALPSKTDLASSPCPTAAHAQEDARENERIPTVSPPETMPRLGSSFARQPRLSDRADKWAAVANTHQFEIGQDMEKHWVVAGILIDVAAREVAEACHVTDPNWRWDWDVLVGWLKEGFDFEAHILAAVTEVARRTNFAAPATLQYFDRPVRLRAMRSKP